MSIPFPTSSVAAKFAQIIEGLRHTVPKFIAQDRTAGPLIMLIWTHLGRLGRRFAALAARAEAGTLPAPRQRPVMRRAGLARKPGPLPTGWGWLGQKMWEARCYGASLQILMLDDPEMAALIAASPQAARIVRSILWMTSIRLAPAIRRVPRPKKAPAPPNPLLEGVPRREVKRSSPMDGSTPPSIPPARGGTKEASRMGIKEVRFWSQPRGKLRSTAGPLRKG